jgi:hypothetical protein
VQPLHVAAWIELQEREHSAPTAKQRLAPLRHLLDWLVTGQGIVHLTDGKTSVIGRQYGSVLHAGIWTQVFSCQLREALARVRRS